MKVLITLPDSEVSLFSKKYWETEKSEIKKIADFLKGRTEFCLVVERDYLFPIGFIIEETIDPGKRKADRVFMQLAVDDVSEMLRENYVDVYVKLVYVEFVSANVLIRHLSENWLSEEVALSLLKKTNTPLQQ